MSQGYFLIGLGEKYIVENFYLVNTIRKQNDRRPVSILVKEEDYISAKRSNVFDDIITYEPDKNDPVFKDCNNPFEIFCVYVRINMNKYCIYDETINLDSDVLCQYSTDSLWNFLGKREECVANLGNKIADPNWHWGQVGSINKNLNRTLPSMHAGFNYIRKGEKSDKFFELSRDIFLKYDSYGFKRFFRGSRTEEAIFSLAYSMMNISPIGYTEYPIMTFNYKMNEILPSNKQVLLDENDRVVLMEDYIPFIHMFEKMEGINYQELYKQIMSKFS